MLITIALAMKQFFGLIYVAAITMVVLRIIGHVLWERRKTKRSATSAETPAARVAVNLTAFDIYLVVAALVCMVGFVGSGYLSKVFLRHDLRTFMDRSGTELRVRVVGETEIDRARLLEHLQQTGSVMAHHSHAEDELFVVLEAGDERRTLMVGRDSTRDQEWWVHEMRAGKKIEIGRFDVAEGEPW